MLLESLVGASVIGETSLKLSTSVVCAVFAWGVKRVMHKRQGIPVMVLGVCLGKRYTVEKYMPVFVLSAGVSLFFAGTASQTSSEASLPPQAPPSELKAQANTRNIGTLEDKYMHEIDVGVFEFMFRLNVYKSIWAFM
ncbi:hypothetical protein H257_02053 [Aphanomyces astaci]|uniref:Uncharacterized protein n=1 Tax=Aphanomyces astaci TaxID=112090 RepID=W4H7G0_APHAT|nr:hypothetical protein H257_02053 [Aphanomyces astaci]ETV87043.1 hypothetical protein H257_02053 [Aphanomyces astaci]|eukprot:XP_009823842.1 hypothetical protein H257_02053 [Aphanomyces astaci]